MILKMTKVLFPIDLSERNRDLRNYLLSQFGKYVNLPTVDFLEIGIGNGRFGFLLGNSVAHYYGIDPDKQYIQIARTNIPEGADITYQVGSADQIPFDPHFDIVFYANSWHFIENHQRALEEAKRILKQEGIVAILEPSENTTNWASPRLRKDSPEFDETAYQRKLENLERGRRALLEQRILKMTEQEYDQETKHYFYVLKRGDL